MTMPTRDKWTALDYLNFIEGWSFDRLGYPKPPTDAEARRAHNVVATMGHMVGAPMPDHIHKAIPPETRRAMFFAAGQAESRAA